MTVSDAFDIARLALSDVLCFRFVEESIIVVIVAEEALALKRTIAYH